MKRKTRESLIIMLLPVEALAVLGLVFSRLRIIVVALMSWWVLGLLILIAIVVLFLALDNFIDRWQ